MAEPSKIKIGRADACSFFLIMTVFIIVESVYGGKYYKPKKSSISDSNFSSFSIILRVHPIRSFDNS
jgi:hypothetical protein